jgi:serine/threonine-protein kinase
VGDRSFAGYAYHQRLAAGPFGDVFRALGGSGQEARIVHVQQRLADLPAFTTALYRFGREMSALDHPRVVAIRHVGNSGSAIAVLTDSVAGPVALDAIQERAAGAAIPRDIAMAIGLGAIEGLSHAHSLGVVHGAIHPRSVLVDFHGGIKLADFGLAWALAAAAVAAKNPSLLTGLRGYLAPEMALGEQPTVRSDVYGAGALLVCLWTGQPPAGAPHLEDAPPALVRLLERSLAVDPLARLVNGTELEELLEEVITSAGVRVAPPDEVAAWVSRVLSEPRARRDSTDEIGAETSDLIRGLKAPEPVKSARRAVSDVIAGLEAEAGTGGTARYPGGIQVTPAPVLTPRSSGRRPDFDSGAATTLDDESSYVGEHTDVEAQSQMLGADADPISAILKLPDESRLSPPPPQFDDSTPLPTPAPDPPGTITRHLDALEAEEKAARARIGKKQKFGKSDAVDSLAATLPIGATVDQFPTPVPPGGPSRGTFPGPAPPPPRRASTNTAGAVRPASDIGGMFDAYNQIYPPRKKRVFIWIALTVFAASALAMYLYTQTDLFDPGRRAAEDRAAEQADEDALARHASAQVQPVDLTITSPEPDAAVWLLLGRTPFESMSLSSAMVHELRFEHEGYLPLDLRVTGYEWKGDDKQARRAAVSATLQAGEPKGPVPAVGPEPASPPPPGPPGRGVLAVTSTPPGAQVWMLIGFTPRATITGLPAGRDVEVKVLKDGFLPGFTSVKAGEWYLSGRDGPVQSSIERAVALAPAKAPPPKKKTGKRGK